METFFWSWVWHWQGKQVGSFTALMLIKGSFFVELSLRDMRKMKIFSSHTLPVAFVFFKCLYQVDGSKISGAYSMLNHRGHRKAKLKRHPEE